jgi:hypothetical protein
MRQFLAAICVAGLVSVAGFATICRADNEKTTVQGELVDTYCYSDHGAKGADHKDCGQACAKSGIPVAVLSDGKAITLVTNPVPLAQYMASQIRVTGALNKDTNIILPDKVEVQQEGKWQEVKLSDEHHAQS